MPDLKFALYELTDEGVAIITFNRPDQLNAMNRRMLLEVLNLLDIADRDPKVRTIVLTGAGRAFCAGADLSAGVEAFAPIAEDESKDERDWGGVLALRIFELMKPTIAAINGAAVGIGATLCLPCDVRIASDKSRFGYVFARRGIVLDGCASWFLPRVVGIGLALRWSISGSLVTADEALSGGLVASLHEPSEVLPAALEIAREMSAQTSPVSVALIRALLWHGLTENHPMEAHRLESSLVRFTMNSEDAREGVASFLEKRPAHFRGAVPTDLPGEWPLWRTPDF